MDNEKDNPLVVISELQPWVEELKEIVDDDVLDHCLQLVAKLIAKPNVPQQQVAVVCVQLASMAVKFRTQYNLYMGLKKGTEGAANKKNMYRGIYEGIDRLVDALKYLVKT